MWKTEVIREHWSFDTGLDESQATRWRSFFQNSDTQFRLLLDLVPGEPTDPKYDWNALLQVCTGEQRKALTDRGEYCRVGPAQKMTPSKISVSRFSLTISMGNTRSVKEFIMPQGTCLMTPSEHELGIVYSQHSSEWSYDLDEDDDRFVTLEFMAEVANTRSVGEEPSPTAITSTCAIAMLSNLLDSGVLSDVVLLVGGEELRAHRCVLAAASPVFRRMFAHEASEESRLGRVDVQGVRREVMAAALRYLYGQELGADLDVDMLCDLLVLAERYELLQLKKLCEEALLVRNGEGDPLQLLTIAVRNNAPLLREAAMKRIVESTDRKSIINAATLDEVIKSHPDVARELILRL